MPADVDRALQLAANHGGYGHHAAKLLPDERQVTPRSELGITGKGGKFLLVSESGLYALINRSDRPEARVFQRWVNHEVLPSIRKTGSYALADHGWEAMPLPMDIAEAVTTAVAAAQNVAKPRLRDSPPHLSQSGIPMRDADPRRRKCLNGVDVIFLGR